MLLSLLFSSPAEFILIFGGLILAIGLHEAAHCFTADRLGDPTPRSAGRLTLNPLAHLDPIGTFAILIAGFGWGKPAPFDPYNLKNPRRDTALIALAGPASNVVLSIIFALILKTPIPVQVADIVFTLLVLNLNLAFFNLIPVPPLDGSKILSAFLSRQQALRFEHFAARQSNLLLLLLILPLMGGRSIASVIISPIIAFFVGILV